MVFVGNDRARNRRIEGKRGSARLRETKSDAEKTITKKRSKGKDLRGFERMK